MSVPIIHFIETAVDITLSAIQGKISRVYNSDASPITVTFGSSTYDVPAGKTADFIYTGTVWLDPDAVMSSGVAGPGSSVDDDFASWDGTDGNVLQSSGFGAADFVQMTGNQSIDGVKTFTSIPVLPASNPTANNEAVRKLYVDSHDAFAVSYFEDTTLTAANTPISVQGTYGINETDMSYLNVYGYATAACVLRITNNSGSNRTYHYLLISGTTPSTATASLASGANLDISISANTSTAIMLVLYDGFSAQFRRGASDSTLRFFCEGRK